MTLNTTNLPPNKLGNVKLFAYIKGYLFKNHINKKTMCNCKKKKLIKPAPIKLSSTTKIVLKKPTPLKTS